MPTGIIINSLAVVIGGLIGARIRNRMGSAFKEQLNMILGLCSMAMGISSIVLMENMPAVVFSVIIGTAFGLLIHLGVRINAGAEQMQRQVSRFAPNNSGASTDPALTSMLVTVIVLFCVSGTGIYGSLISGMNGDHSILIAKSILDLFTAMIFACYLGAVVSAVALPQLIIFLFLFFVARLIYPLTTPGMINDFKACGGTLMVATGFRILRTKEFPTADMIPSMILVMPLSWIWTNVIMPLLA